MSTTQVEIPVQSEPPRKQWTRVECDALVKLGLFDGQRLELIEGDLIDKMGKGRPHVNSVALLLRWAVHVFGFGRVLQESPIDVASEDNPTNEPEPDLVVLKRDLSEFSKENPRPEDLELVVEVAGSTLWFDLATKAALCARASIADYWVLDLSGRRMIVHRDPREGRFESVLIYGSEESVAPLAAPGTPLRIADLLVE